MSKIHHISSSALKIQEGSKNYVSGMQHAVVVEGSKNYVSGIQHADCFLMFLVNAVSSD